ncbi:uncharacterized protein [Atheta coriaria]|uniref:uncharacterized protein n=1 Tax=Dalotia coriaria TaxID=877792 RepID=UPI0031F399BD
MIALLFTLVLVAPSLQLGPAMGPVGKINIKKLQECPNFSGGQLKMQLAKDSKGQKVFNAQLNLQEDYNNKYTFLVRVHKWTGSEYKKDMMKYEGAACDYINKFLPAVRERVYKLAKVSGTCEAKKGKYDIKAIFALEKDLKVPALPYGTFQLEVEIYNAKKAKIVCLVVDVDSVAK